MWLNNCSNLANVFLGCWARWLAAGYQALSMAGVPNPAQSTRFPALHSLQVSCALGERTGSMCDIFAYPLPSSPAISWQTCLGEMLNYHSFLLHQVDQVSVLQRLFSWDSSTDFPALSWAEKEGGCWNSVFPVPLQRSPRVCSVVSELILDIA